MGAANLCSTLPDCHAYSTPEQTHLGPRQGIQEGIWEGPIEVGAQQDPQREEEDEPQGDALAAAGEAAGVGDQDVRPGHRRVEQVDGKAQPGGACNVPALHLR